MFITHSMGVVAQLCDEVIVMYQGRVVERASVEDIFYHPKHPYTRSLLRSIPRIGAAEHAPLEVIKGAVPDPYTQVPGCSFHPRCPDFIGEVCHDGDPARDAARPAPSRHGVRCHLYDDELTRAGSTTEAWPMTETKREPGSAAPKRAKPDGREHPRDPEPAEGPLLEVRGLQKHFPIKGGAMRRVIGQVKAVDGVSLSVDRGETVAIVGESGCGKSTTGRTIIRLEEPTGGEVIFRHPELGPVHVEDADTKTLDKIRPRMQFIFQDPMASLDSRMTVGRVISEPLVINKVLKGQRAEGPGGRTADRGRAAARARQPLPTRVLRRPAPAHRHRPRAGPGPGPDHLRRAGVRPGRLGPGPGHQPAWRTCRSDWGLPTCSSATTCPWWSTSPTGSW